VDFIDRSSGVTKWAVNLSTRSGRRGAAFVTHDEPLFGLECQESVRGLVPFFSGFVD
jgi:hypothetical protein